jgi:hypothetical protein
VNRASALGSEDLGSNPVRVQAFRKKTPLFTYMDYIYMCVFFVCLSEKKALATKIFKERRYTSGIRKY